MRFLFLFSCFASCVIWWYILWPDLASFRMSRHMSRLPLAIVSLKFYFVLISMFISTYFIFFMNRLWHSYFVLFQSPLRENELNNIFLDLYNKQRVFITTINLDYWWFQLNSVIKKMMFGLFEPFFIYLFFFLILRRTDLLIDFSKSVKQKMWVLLYAML